MGIPLLLRDFQGTVGTVGNRFVVFHGLHRPAFSTALRALVGAGLAQLAGGRVAADHVRAIPDRHRPIQMFMDSDRAASQRTAEVAEYETATRCYSWFVNELSRQRCMLSQEAFQQLLKLVEHTRLECERVRLAIGESRLAKSESHFRGKRL